MFHHIKSLGYRCYIFTYFKVLSGTYQNGYLAKEMVNGINVAIVDTKTTVSI